MLHPVVVAIDRSAELSGFFSVRDLASLNIGGIESEGILDNGRGGSSLYAIVAVGYKGNRVVNGASSQKEGGSNLDHGDEYKISGLLRRWVSKGSMPR